MTVESQSYGTRPYGTRRERSGDAESHPSHFTAGGSPVDLNRAYTGTTYYDVPPIKRSHYGWLIAAYFFVGGLAAAAQFIATIADLVGGRRDRSLVRAGRYIALAGALASPALLIGDLQNPRRWFNMLRIYKGTSAMSIGSWALSGFGAFTGVTAFGQLLADLTLGWGSWISRLFQLPAALAGGVVALYTGTLMAATNLPFVAAAFPFLSSLFASSAASTAAAALTLTTEAGRAPESTKRSLNLVALAAGLSELTFALLVERGWRQHGVSAPRTQPQLLTAYRVGVLGAGIAAPLAVHAAEAITRRRSGPATVLAALSALVGGFILRAVFVFGANASGDDPGDYFRMTQPDGRQAWRGQPDGSR